MNPRTIKPQTPVRLIAGLSLLGILLVFAIAYAVFYSQRQIEDARLRGVITEKHFNPQPEQQISIGSHGLSSTDKKGEFILIVEVPKRDGSIKDYTVYVDETRYNAVNVGDSFDVGPYLVAPAPTP